MSEQLQIIFHEYKTIFALRQRCIKNIDESMRTYLFFLGFIVTVVSFVINNYPQNIISIAGLLVICSLVGFFIYGQIVESYINLINYSRKLNLTRRFFIKFNGIKKYIYLPISGDEPNFVETGFTDRKFSEFGLLKLIQILNCLTAAFSCWLILIAIRNAQIYKIEDLYIVIILLVIIISFYLLHPYINEKQIKLAKIKWEKEMKVRK